MDQLLVLSEAISEDVEVRRCRTVAHYIYSLILREVFIGNIEDILLLSRLKHDVIFPQLTLYLRKLLVWLLL